MSNRRASLVSAARWRARSRFREGSPSGEPKSPQSPAVTYMYRKPRIGNQYQSKVPKKVEDPVSQDQKSNQPQAPISSRPLPVPMSKDYPFVTGPDLPRKSQFQQEDTGQTQGNAASQQSNHPLSFECDLTSRASPPTSEGFTSSGSTLQTTIVTAAPNRTGLSSPRSDVTTVRRIRVPNNLIVTLRGGALLSERHNDGDSASQDELFWSYVRPLFSPVSDMEFTNTVQSKSWLEKVVQWHQRRSPGPGRRKKRKRSTDEAPIWEIFNNLTEHHSTYSSSKKLRTSFCYNEDEAHAWQYFFLRHAGQQSRAQLEALVQLSAGKASPTFRLRQRSLKRDITHVSSHSWRNQYNQRIKAMASDYRTQKRNKYTHNDAAYGESADVSNCIRIDDVDTAKDVWRGLFAIGQAMLQYISEGNIKHAPPIESLVSFLGRCTNIRPPPEELFTPSIAGDMNECLDKLMGHAIEARKVQAKLIDMLHPSFEDGVDLDAVQKYLDQAGKAMCFNLFGMNEVHTQLDHAAKWQKRLDALVDTRLSDLEDLAAEARSQCFRSKALVQLEGRIEKCHQLRDRILDWNANRSQGKKESVRFVTAMVRDANRVKTSFVEADELNEFSREVESWIERANIAIRSRISLDEIKALIIRGEELPINLNEFTEKLKARVSLADSWIERLKAEIPLNSFSPFDDSTKLEWMSRMREALVRGKHNMLQELASEGARIAVEVDCVKLLQVELDAKTWTSRAKRWLPNDTTDGTGRKGKLDDIRDHLEKGGTLRDRLPLSDHAQQQWKLEGEAELTSIVKAADTWFTKYKPFLGGDNRRSEDRSCLSITKLRQIVDEANSIRANIGSPVSKISRILAQAQSWYEEYEPLLSRCNIVQGSSDLKEANVDVDEMTKAVEAAASNVSLDLDEALELKKLVESSKDWLNRSMSFVPKRNKRQGRGKKGKVSIDDITRLIEEAPELPIDTSAEVQRLQNQLLAIQEWRAKAQRELELIVSGFIGMREGVDKALGPPCDYKRHNWSISSSSDIEENIRVDNDIKDEKKAPDDVSHSETTSTASEQETSTAALLGPGATDVNKLVHALRNDAKSSGISTGEGDTADELEKVSKWCSKSLKYLETQREVFDKRFFGAFDRFVQEGREFLKLSQKSETQGDPGFGDSNLAERLKRSWGSLVSDQLQRLDVLLVERERFTSWCNNVEKLLFSGEKRPSVTKIQELAAESHLLPGVSMVVQKVRALAQRVTDWVARAENRLHGGTSKMSIQEAKGLLEEGEKLKIMCPHLKALKNALRISRNWATRVSKCKVDQGAIHVVDIRNLIGEHDSLLIEMPEELSKLRQAMKNYCICRSPYRGFMVGCDECEDWFHGPCIGFSEARADRVEKFVCIRCSVSGLFRSSAKQIVDVVRKWTFEKDRKKARQVEAQKHQRKVRKETKEIEKTQEQIEELMARLVSNNSNNNNQIASVEITDGSDATSPNVRVLSDKTKVDSFHTTPENDSSNLRLKLERAESTIKQCNERKHSLHVQLLQRKAVYEEEDSFSHLLRSWCLNVRSLILAPATEEIANRGRPSIDGSLSAAMSSLIEEADRLNITRFADIGSVLNSFKCMCWSLRSLSILAVKPTLGEMQSLMEAGSLLKLPDEKAFKMMKLMTQRAVVWRSKVQKALAPIPGETKPFNLEVLKELASSAQHIPLIVAEESILLNAIDDRGCRHCICGGPNDGSFMLSCDKCDAWFHGPCVNVTKEESDSLQNWLCPPCSGLGSNIMRRPSISAWVQSMGNLLHQERDKSTEAPDPNKLWPPFGLAGSKEAADAVGDDCIAIPNEILGGKSASIIGHVEKLTAENCRVRSFATDQQRSLHSSLTLQVPMPRSMSSDATEKSEAQPLPFCPSIANRIASQHLFVLNNDC